MIDLPLISSADALVTIHQQGGVRMLTLNRPASLNSFTQAMHAELRTALRNAAQDPKVRALVLTGAGRGFCAGQDLNDPAMAPGADGRVDIGAVIEANYKPLALQLQTLPVPVVVAVNGVAAGAGANMALCCDLVLAGRSASFIQAFSRIGLVPDCGGTWLLPRLVGRAVALGLALGGDRISAEEALQIGLIWKVYDEEALLPEALAQAQRLAALPTRALVATRNAFDASQSLTLEDSLGLEARAQRDLGHAADFAEGVAAFREKRTPRFSDR